MIIGGGCYGCYHARQLLRGAVKGALEFQELVIVDRDPACAARKEFAGQAGVRFVTADWVDFVDDYLDRALTGTADVMVPTPIGPHLMYEWLRRRVERRSVLHAAAFERLPATPYAERSPTGTGYLSFATWTCPVTCVEPAICPVTRGPKEWEMDEAVFAFARDEAGEGRPFDEVTVFRCRPLAFGIAAWPTAHALRVRDRFDRLLAMWAPEGLADGVVPRACRILVATTSSCHGVADLLELHPRHTGPAGERNPA
ncbi:MAG TPA: hypothetical protein VF720_15295 [Candidatus Eisenbacteria bacterium]